MGLNPDQIYQTGRMDLFPFTQENTDWCMDLLLDLYSDPKFLEFLGEADYGRKPFPREDVERRLNSFVQLWTDREFGPYILFSKHGEFLGRGGLKPAVTDGHESIDYVVGLKGKFQRQGYGTELGHFCLSQGFNELALTEIKAVTSPLNIGSQKMLRKLGFTINGTEVKYRGRVAGIETELTYVGGSIKRQDYLQKFENNLL